MCPEHSSDVGDSEGDTTFYLSEKKTNPAPLPPISTCSKLVANPTSSDSSFQCLTCCWHPQTHPALHTLCFLPYIKVRASKLTPPFLPSSDSHGCFFISPARFPRPLKHDSPPSCLGKQRAIDLGVCQPSTGWGRQITVRRWGSFAPHSAKSNSLFMLREESPTALMSPQHSDEWWVYSR